MKNKVMLIVLMTLVAVSLSSCYSVFSGGTSGKVVDADSTTNPKEGIANVDVYAYTSKSEMEKDYKKWSSGSRFSPASKKYAHTVTASDGTFTISKVMWKSMLPTYWRDGDTATAYLLYYHEDFGLVKGDKAMLLSDTISDSVYQELRAIRQRTDLILSIIDVATNQVTDRPMNVRITVPGSKIYEETITGTGTVKISYPRGATPDVSVTFSESSARPGFMMCRNDSATPDYSFITDGSAQVISGVQGDRFTADVYGKKSRISISINGSTGTDGQLVELKENGTTVDSAYTRPTDLGSGLQSHGDFAGLGANYDWVDETYTEKVISKTFSVTAGAKSTSVNVSSAVPTAYAIPQ